MWASGGFPPRPISSCQPLPGHPLGGGAGGNVCAIRINKVRFNINRMKCHWEGKTSAGTRGLPSNWLKDHLLFGLAILRLPSLTRLRDESTDHCASLGDRDWSLSLSSYTVEPRVFQGKEAGGWKG